MAKRGRPPKSTALKLLDGTRPDRINFAEPPRVEGRPTPPATLGPVALAEWNRVVEDLERLGVLSLSDRPTLALYCQHYARWVEAEEHIKKLGMVSSTAAGGAKINPYIQISKDSAKEALRIAQLFGLSPSDRSRLKTEAPKPKTDALTEFLNRRKKG